MSRKWCVTHRLANRAWSIPGLSWGGIAIIGLCDSVIGAVCARNGTSRGNARRGIRGKLELCAASGIELPVPTTNKRQLSQDRYRFRRINPVRSIHGMRYAANVWWMPKNVYVRSWDDNTRNNLILCIIIMYNMYGIISALSCLCNFQKRWIFHHYYKICLYILKK